MAKLNLRLFLTSLLLSATAVLAQQTPACFDHGSSFKSLFSQIDITGGFFDLEGTLRAGGFKESTADSATIGGFVVKMTVRNPTNTPAELTFQDINGPMNEIKTACEFGGTKSNAAGVIFSVDPNITYGPAAGQ